MAKVINFHEDLEKSLERLGGHIEEQKELPETKGLTEKDLVKLSLKSFAAQTKTADEDEGKDVSPPPQTSPLPSYLEGEGVPTEAKAKVEKLINAFFEEGLEKTLVEAGRYGPFIEDAFHDALVDKLLPELKKRGMLSS